MKRVKNLDGYQKWMLVLTAVLPVVFLILYALTVSRVGFRYRNAILVPSPADGGTVYSGKIHGKTAFFTVSADDTGDTIAYQYGDKTYGPYTVREDETAIPKDSEMTDSVRGVEVYEGDTLLFRGSAEFFADIWLLRRADGLAYSIESSVVLDSNGNGADTEEEPTVYTLLELANGPALTHKGDWLAWLTGVFFCVLNAVSILFADELFCLSMSFRIRNAESAEPSEWEIAGRRIGWIALATAAAVIFILGLE